MDKPTSILLIGGGGHCRSCIDVIESNIDFDIQGIVEADGAGKDSVLSYPVVGFDSDLSKLLKKTPCCLITVGQIQHSVVRKKIFRKLKSLGAHLPVIVSSHAYVSRSAALREGTIVMHQALVNVGSHIGHNCIINSQALIEHDVQIGNHCHISTGAKINGGVSIGDECFIGSGAVIKQGVRLVDNVVVGANATVLKDIEQPGVYTGVIK